MRVGALIWICEIVPDSITSRFKPTKYDCADTKVAGSSALWVEWLSCQSRVQEPKLSKNALQTSLAHTRAEVLSRSNGICRISGYSQHRKKFTRDTSASCLPHSSHIINYGVSVQGSSVRKWRRR